MNQSLSRLPSVHTSAFGVPSKVQWQVAGARFLREGCRVLLAWNSYGKQSQKSSWRLPRTHCIWPKWPESKDTKRLRRQFVAFLLLGNQAAPWNPSGNELAQPGVLMCLIMLARRRLVHGALGGLNTRGLRCWRTGFIQNSSTSQQVNL